MKKSGVIIFICFACVIIGIFGFFYKKNIVPTQKPFSGAVTVVPLASGTYVMLGSTTLSVDIADTDASRTQGLSDTQSLAQDHGLLFEFDEPGTWGFWMKDMMYPLDIIWIDASDTIIYAQTDLSPSTYPKIYAPQSPAAYVLEVNAGILAKSGAKIGDAIQIFKK